MQCRLKARAAAQKRQREIERQQPQLQPQQSRSESVHSDRMDESFVTVAPAGASTGALDEVKSYKIHVSSKYLELTKRKFEICRLPHDLELQKGREWELGTPKSVVEPLIDYWLEYYDWRAIETQLNTTLPQFRLAILPPPSPVGLPAPTPLRIHFIHIKSPSESAIPLLLLPSFPFTNLSFTPLFDALSNPQDGGQAYHIICPSLPGLGFSDSFTTPPSQSAILSTTAYLFKTLMSKLNYDSYIVSSTGSGIQSPAGIDYHLPRIITESDPACKGAHLIDPLVPKPNLKTGLGGYLKFSIAKFFHASIFGYDTKDWKASTRQVMTPPVTVPGTPAAIPEDLEAGGVASTASRSGRSSPAQTASGMFRRPFFTPTTSVTSLEMVQHQTASHLTLPTTLTLAYSLCDSPTGLLSLILLGLQKLAPDHNLTEKELTTIVQLAWLPGPEGGLRYRSGADAEIRRAERHNEKPARRASVSITSYADAQGYGAPKGQGQWHSPVWAESKHNVVHVSRRDGGRGLPWEDGDHLLAGIRALTARVFPSSAPPAEPSRLVSRAEDIGEVRTEEDDALELSEVVIHSSSGHNPLHSSQPPSPVISQTYPSMHHSQTRDSSASGAKNARGEEIINEDTEPETPDLQVENLEIKDLLEVPKRPGMEEAPSSETVVGTISEDSVAKMGKVRSGGSGMSGLTRKGSEGLDKGKGVERAGK